MLDIIKSVGYSKYLAGVRPNTIEGMVFIDADLCDAIVTIGIVRTHEYALSKSSLFFPKLPPITDDLDIGSYKTTNNTHEVQHFFDKLLRIPQIMSTEAVKREDAKRKQIMVNFLRQLFEEQPALFKRFF